MSIPSKHHSEIVRLCKVYRAYTHAHESSSSDEHLWRNFLLDCIKDLGLDKTHFLSSSSKD